MTLSHQLRAPGSTVTPGHLWGDTSHWNMLRGLLDSCPLQKCPGLTKSGPSQNKQDRIGSSLIFVLGSIKRNNSVLKEGMQWEFCPGLWEVGGCVCT